MKKYGAEFFGTFWLVLGSADHWRDTWRVDLSLYWRR